MAVPRVFIASSSEGLRVAKALQTGLQRALGDTADVRLWQTEFGLSRTYIESLEIVAAGADFAVAVFSGDDRVRSRGEAKTAPRDNVIFELGLFIGALGRERSFFVRPRGDALKLPSDLMAVVGASYDVPASARALASALVPCVARIAERVRALGTLDRPGSAARERRAGRRRLAAELGGDWWERVEGVGDTALSHFGIDFDEAEETLVLLRGEAFDAQGRLVARWSGQVIEADVTRRRLTYRWTGAHPKTPNAPYHGIGQIEFDAPRDEGGPVMRGHGRFWDVPELDPAKTVVKSIELKRAIGDEVARIVAEGTAAQRRALAKRVHAQW